MAVASAGPYANHLHLTPDRYPCQHVITQFFTGQIFFMMPNQQCQSTEGKNNKYYYLSRIVKRTFIIQTSLLMAMIDCIHI